MLAKVSSILGSCCNSPRGVSSVLLVSFKLEQGSRDGLECSNSIKDMQGGRITELLHTLS